MLFSVIICRIWSFATAINKLLFDKNCHICNSYQKGAIFYQSHKVFYTTLISFVNTLIYTKVLGEIYQTQLNPTVSYLHEPGDRRFSLSLDLAEIFKPILGDRLIFSLLNRKQITEKSFTKGLNY